MNRHVLGSSPKPTAIGTERAPPRVTGQGIVWPELIDTITGEPLSIEPGAVGEAVYTALTREAMPLVRYRNGDVFEIKDVKCPCERTSWRARCIGPLDDMFIVRGVNVYPSAIQAIVAEFKPAITGRLRVVLSGGRCQCRPAGARRA